MVSGTHRIFVNSRRTGIAISAREPKLQGLILENALVQSFPTWKPKVIYTDNSVEFGKSCEDLSWNHCTSTPHRLETNGIAERAVRRVKEGTAEVLLQSGLDEKIGGQILWNVIPICETFKIFV